MNLQEVVAHLQHRHNALMGQRDVDPKEIAGLEHDLVTLLNQFPDHPGVLFSLGTLFQQTNRVGVGIALLHRCLDCGARGAGPWINLGGAHKTEHRDATAAECYKKAAEEAEKHPQIVDGANIDLAAAYHGLASLYVNAGQPDRCIYWADECLKVNPKDRFARWNKALALLERGSYADGFDLYDEAGFETAGNPVQERKLKTYGGLPKWDGTPGKTVICYGEQGVGDEIMFASVLPDLMKDCKVIIDCDKRLERMFKAAFPDAEGVYPTSGIDEPFPWIKNHKPDAYLPMGSLGKWYRRDKSAFPKTPFLIADEEKRAKWRAELEKFDGLKVGLSWAGGLKKTRHDMRTIRLEKLAPILGTEGVNWFSLQYHRWGADEASQAATNLGIPIHHWGDVIEDYDETAAFVSELDLVITVNTSLLHLCGALGVPTWCLTPKYVAWRYGVKGGNPWYGSVNMHRQKDAGQWGPVISRVKRDLARLAGKAAKEAA